MRRWRRRRWWRRRRHECLALASQASRSATPSTLPSLLSFSSLLATRRENPCHRRDQHEDNQCNSHSQDDTAVAATAAPGGLPTSPLWRPRSGGSGGSGGSSRHGGQPRQAAGPWRCRPPTRNATQRSRLLLVVVKGRNAREPRRPLAIPSHSSSAPPCTDGPRDRLSSAGDGEILLHTYATVPVPPMPLTSATLVCVLSASELSS